MKNIIKQIVKIIRGEKEETIIRKTPRLSASSVPPTLLLLTQKVTEANSPEVAAESAMYPMHCGAATRPLPKHMGVAGGIRHEA